MKAFIPYLGHSYNIFFLSGQEGILAILSSILLKRDFIELQHVQERMSEMVKSL